jgi:hypothetical protein
LLLAFGGGHLHTWAVTFFFLKKKSIFILLSARS